MRITVAIDEQELREIQVATGETKKSSAVQKAVQSFLHERRKRAFLEKVRAGKTDFPLTNDELEAMFEDDTY